MKYLEAIDTDSSVDIKTINKCRIETDYDFLSEDEKLWYTDPLYNYNEIIKIIIEFLYKTKPRKYDFRLISTEVDKINIELNKFNKPLLNNYFILKAFKEFLSG